MNTHFHVSLRIRAGLKNGTKSIQLVDFVLLVSTRLLIIVISYFHSISKILLQMVNVHCNVEYVNHLGNTIFIGDIFVSYRVMFHNNHNLITILIATYQCDEPL